MTGFGRSQVTEFGYAMVVEVRSVNGRYAEVSARLPRVMANMEAHLVEAVQKRVSRGKVLINVSLEGANGRPTLGAEVVADLELAERYRDALETVRNHLGLSDPINLNVISHFNDVITLREAEFDEKLARRLLDDALAGALDELDAMRRREGEALARDFAHRLGVLSRQLAQIIERAPVRVEEAKAKLKERIAALLTTDVVDDQRLAMEVAVISDRSDVTEECIRFRSHLDQFTALMKEETAGRKLNFLLQEMNREINTIGSKSNDATIAHVVVEMKDEIERLREQVQNIE